jgi:hypothetical protein
MILITIIFAIKDDKILANTHKFCSLAIALIKDTGEIIDISAEVFEHKSCSKYTQVGANLFSFFGLILMLFIQKAVWRDQNYDLYKSLLAKEDPSTYFD